MEHDENTATPHPGVPETHWLNNTPPRRPSKARMFGQIGLVLWAFWVLAGWHIAGESRISDEGFWWRQVLIQATFWLALSFTLVWVATTVWRDEQSCR